MPRYRFQVRTETHVMLSVVVDCRTLTTPCWKSTRARLGGSGVAHGRHGRCWVDPVRPSNLRDEKRGDEPTAESPFPLTSGARPARGLIAQRPLDRRRPGAAAARRSGRWRRGRTTQTIRLRTVWTTQ